MPGNGLFMLNTLADKPWKANTFLRLTCRKRAAVDHSVRMRMDEAEAAFGDQDPAVPNTPLVSAQSV